MATTAVGAKAINILGGHAQHCFDCGAAAGLIGKSLSFGLGLGLGGMLPIFVWGGGLYLAHCCMRRHMQRDIIMSSDQ